MKIGGSDDSSPLIPPVEPVPGTGKSGEEKKSPGQRLEEIRVLKDNATFSVRTEEEEINLKGISPDDARKLLDANVFKGWGTDYTGPLPGGLMQLQRALQHAESGPVPGEVQIFLEHAGTMMASASGDMQKRGDGPHLEGLKQLHSHAQEVAAKLAAERGREK